MTGAAEERTPRRSLGAIDEDNLFATGLVTSAPHARTRRERIGGQLSLVGHVLIILLVVFVPIFWPEKARLEEELSAKEEEIRKELSVYLSEAQDEEAGEEPGPAGPVEAGAEGGDVSEEDEEEQGPEPSAEE